MRRTILFAVMIGIVLTVMFLPIYALAFNVLGMLQTGAFLLRHHAIRLGLVFNTLQAILSALETRRLLLRQRPRLNALLDTLLLIGLALVENRRIGGLCHRDQRR